MLIIFDESDLCIRGAIVEGNLCGRDAVNKKDLCAGDRIDIKDLRVRSVVDQDDFCALNSTRADKKDLCTIIGSGAEEAIYRFDTTRITFDNTSLDWSYFK